jgi:hypothetical protein
MNICIEYIIFIHIISIFDEEIRRYFIENYSIYHDSVGMD